MRLNDVMKSRPGLNTAVGVAFAIIAGLLLLGYLTQFIKGSGDGSPVVIPVAARDIETGTLVDESMMTSMEIAGRYVVPGTIQRREDITGSRALRFIGKGEPFTSSAVTGGDGSGTLASRIPPSLRAYSLRLGPLSGAGHELRPGDHVDVLATNGNPPKTTTILTDRLILSSGGVASGGEEARSGVLDITLLVSPDEAERLAQAEFEGEISISLCPLSSDGGRQPDD